MRAQVEAKLAVLQSFLAELEGKAARYRHTAHDLEVEVERPTDARPDRAVGTAG